MKRENEMNEMKAFKVTILLALTTASRAVGIHHLSVEHMKKNLFF